MASNISNPQLSLFCPEPTSEPIDVTTNELKTNADIVLFTLGVGYGGPTQETPDYLLQIAQAHPDQKIEIIHCDPSFGDYVVEWLNSHGQMALKAPWCLIHEKEWKLLSVKKGELGFQHTRLDNVMVRILNARVPRFSPGLSQSGESPEDLSGLIRGLLEHGSEVFLGYHYGQFQDHHYTFSSVYNSLRERFSDKIHLYIHSSHKTGTFVYTGKYHPIFGEFARDLVFWNPTIGGRDAFQRFFSQDNPASSDLMKVKECMDNFIDESRKPGATTPKKRPIQSVDGTMCEIVVDRNFIHSVSTEEEEILRSYLNPTSRYQVRYLSEVKPSTFGHNEVSPSASLLSAITSLFHSVSSYW
jgi:hypothetical protein